MGAPFFGEEKETCKCFRRDGTMAEDETDAARSRPRRGQSKESESREDRVWGESHIKGTYQERGREFVMGVSSTEKQK
jgi:hypothetical protein